MFDYESLSHSESNFIFSRDTFVYKNEKDISCSHELNSKLQPMFKICFEKGKIMLKVKDDKGMFNTEELFGVVRFINFEDSSGYYLREGDYIKLGKTFVTIKQIHFKNSKENTLSFEDKVDPFTELNKLNVLTLKQQHKRKKHVPCCKICLLEDNFEDNPLVNPCGCIGSMKYLHVECLKSWLKSKLSVSNQENVMVMNIRNIKCEICKKEYPEKIKYNGKTIYLLDINKNDSDYIIIESQIKDTKSLLVVKFGHKKSLLLGRSQESDIKINDISVSRVHSQLKFENKRFSIEDKNSKFGTLFLITENVELLAAKPFAVQMGKFFIEIDLIPGCCSLSKLSQLFAKKFAGRKVFGHRRRLQ